MLTFQSNLKNEGSAVDHKAVCLGRFKQREGRGLQFSSSGIHRQSPFMTRYRGWQRLWAPGVGSYRSGPCGFKGGSIKVESCLLSSLGLQKGRQIRMEWDFWA